MDNPEGNPEIDKFFANRSHDVILRFKNLKKVSKQLEKDFSFSQRV